MASIGAIFTSTYDTKQLNPWPNSSASQVMGYSQLSACQGEMDPFEEHLNTCCHWQASETSHSKSSLGNFQHRYLAELLVNVYSHHLMVKTVSCCCVCASQLFSDPVINNDYLHHIYLEYFNTGTVISLPALLNHLSWEYHTWQWRCKSNVFTNDPDNDSNCYFSQKYVRMNIVQFHTKQKESYGSKIY